MSFDTHVFYRPKCDYPGCGSRWAGAEYDWNYDEAGATAEVTDDECWIVLYKTPEQPCFFCQKHTRGGGCPDTFDDDDPEYRPHNEELTDYYLDVSTDQPLPAPECEDTILAVLKGKTQ
ncbi:hypothetical protein [Bifidobacterium moukalabense]|uniref:hypothetical protein n=1 Tax=Bifidobacterium moukalabense TaxID=1333651 RepID=UPI0010FA3D51|nr:hypothetical protein [Bifidobacterium moukalabense]